VADGGRDARGDLAGFAHALRGAGVDVGTGQLVAFAEAAAALAPVDTGDLYWAGRASLVNEPSDLGAYDRVFASWFQAQVPGTIEGVDDSAGEIVARLAPVEEHEPPGGPDEPPETAGAVASPTEQLRSRRFDRATEAELAAMRRLMARIDVALPERTTRRSRPDRRPGDLDLRRSLRRALQTDGEVLDRRWRRRRSERRRLVLLLDVSGSMAGFSRALLQFAFSARTHASSVEVFAFGTQLTRLTPDLARRDPDRAIDAAAGRVNDWDGGTRIGHAVEELNRRWGRWGITRGAVVVICSDGLERDDPARLAAAMDRLHRTAHAVVWVNPLKGDPRYEPAARGMAASLPYVDRFLAGHDLNSLDAFADVVAAL
jgi:uncharacterized protein with von Willebrand factor type A (vWA) domain